MEFMATLPDKHYDLAIVDPPYGININMNIGRRKHDIRKHAIKKWDSNPPDEKYFYELSRISENQIIWGANNFGMKPSKGWIVWDKDISGDVDFSECELAYTSYLSNIKRFKYRAQTNENYSVKIHPTQKPISLYKWILQNYAKPGWTIFDSHVGSGSLRIACHDLGFDFEGCEIDNDYWEAQEARYQNHIKQNELFEKEDIQKLVYREVLL